MYNVYNRRFEVSSLTNGEDTFLAVTLLFAGYGISVCPFTYLLSFLFDKHTTAQYVVLFVNLLSSLLLVIASYVMGILPDPPPPVYDDDLCPPDCPPAPISLRDLNDKLILFFRLIPGFCLGDGLLDIAAKALLDTIGVSGIGDDDADSQLGGGLDNSTIVNLVYMCACALGYLVLVIMVDIYRTYPQSFKITTEVSSTSAQACNALRANVCIACGWKSTPAMDTSPLLAEEEQPQLRDSDTFRSMSHSMGGEFMAHGPRAAHVSILGTVENTGTEQPKLDPDVLREKQRVESGEDSDLDCLRLIQVSGDR